MRDSYRAARLLNMILMVCHLNRNPLLHDTSHQMFLLLMLCLLCPGQFDRESLTNRVQPVPFLIGTKQQTEDIFLVGRSWKKVLVRKENCSAINPPVLWCGTNDETDLLNWTPLISKGMITIHECIHTAVNEASYRMNYHFFFYLYY